MIVITQHHNYDNRKIRSNTKHVNCDYFTSARKNHPSQNKLFTLRNMALSSAVKSLDRMSHSQMMTRWLL